MFSRVYVHIDLYYLFYLFTQEVNGTNAVIYICVHGRIVSWAGVSLLCTHL